MERSMFWLSLVALAMSVGCAEGVATRVDCEPGTEAVPIQGEDGVSTECVPCACGSIEGECVPCLETDQEVEIPEGQELEMPQLNQAIIDQESTLFLNQDETGRFSIPVNEERPVGVRVSTYFGNPAPGVVVNFEIPDDWFVAWDDSGARLGAASAVSNQFGVASVMVRGGSRPAFLQLDLWADNAEGLSYDIDVTLPPTLGTFDPGQPNPMPNNMVNCLKTKGVYNIVNRYQPASVFGDGVANTIETINRLLTDPGGLVADMIADRIGGGFVGGLVRGAIAPAVNYVFRYVVDQYFPDWAQRAITIGGDVTGALTDLEIRGKLQLSDENPVDCTLQGIHRWEKLIFVWRDGCMMNAMNCGEHEIPMEELGLSVSETQFDARITQHTPVHDVMVIEEHNLQMNLGVAVFWFLERVILPQRFQGVNSFGELLSLVIPCDVVGDQAANIVGGGFLGFGVSSLVEGACRSGVEAAGQTIVRQLIESLTVDTFTMTGECKLQDRDRNRTVDIIKDGVWSDGLQGEFSGERLR